MLEAPNVFRDRFTDELHMDYERDGSTLELTVNNQGTVQGDLVYFDIVDPGDEMVEKGRDGKIPTSDLGLNQVSTAWTQRHKKYRIDNFDKWRANPNMVSAMQKRGLGASHRRIDQLIIDQLDTGSVSGGSGILSTLAEVQEWVETLADNEVPITEGNNDIFGVVTLRAWGQMNRIPEFKSADYTDIKVVDRMYSRKFKHWLGVNWITHTGLTGKKTNAAKCKLYHRSALGFMLNGKPNPIFFDNTEDAYGGVRFEVTGASKLLLNRGVATYTHDDTQALTA